MNKKPHTQFLQCLSLLALCLVGLPAFASGGVDLTPNNLIAQPVSIFALVLFFIAYVLVVLEDVIHLRKSKPVIVAAGGIWVMVAIAYSQTDSTEKVQAFLNHNLLEYVQLLLFLLAAMTYINTMEERGVFSALRTWLINKGFGYKSIFWITGVLAFCISPLADNLTTALLMAQVAISVAGGREAILASKDKTNFAVIACVNIVVAANAGGAFSPFGDITTLMVWQSGKVAFTEFLPILTPSIVNWIIPALIMAWFVPNLKPEQDKAAIKVRRGGYVVVVLFLFTILMAVSGHVLFHLPPMLGMMTGLGLLSLYGYYLSVSHGVTADETTGGPVGRFNIYTQLQRSEWDTLMFFYGVIMCVGGLSALGYLAYLSDVFYSGFGPTITNILVGILSAIVDNIPVMFAVISMNPDMDLSQWLLVTLTAGVGGSLLSVGSAAGVALMGQARGIYTFFAHLKWSWAIAIGYVASVATHLMLNV